MSSDATWTAQPSAPADGRPSVPAATTHATVSPSPRPRASGVPTSVTTSSTGVVRKTTTACSMSMPAHIARWMRPISACPGRWPVRRSRGAAACAPRRP